jgi:hypothetical protein
VVTSPIGYCRGPQGVSLLAAAVTVRGVGQRPLDGRPRLKPLVVIPW